MYRVLHWNFWHNDYRVFIFIAVDLPRKLAPFPTIIILLWNVIVCTHHFCLNTRSVISCPCSSVWYSRHYYSYLFIVDIMYRNVTSDSILNIEIFDLNVTVYIWYYIVLYMLGFLHLIFSAWMVTEYFLLNWNNFVLPSFISKIVTKIRNKFENG